MLPKKLRQLAINTTVDGCIGIGKKLLFSTPADLSRFAKFTKGTVLIVGKNTAIQMLDARARVHSLRPMVVVSKDGCVSSTHTTRDDERHIYYAPSLKEAVETADALVLEHNLNGWTIAGGKQVYNEFFEVLGKTSMRLTGAYAFRHDMKVADPEAVRLNYDWEQMYKLIVRNMITPSTLWNEVNGAGVLADGTTGRTVDPRAYSIWDKTYIAPDAVTVRDDVLFVETTSGPLVLDRHFIKGWYFREGVNSVTLILANSELTVRPASEAALCSLLFELNVSARY